MAHSSTEVYQPLFQPGAHSRVYTVTSGAWPYSEQLHPYHDINMGGSTSDEQSVFDTQSPPEGNAGVQQASESSASPPDQQQGNDCQPADQDCPAGAGDVPNSQNSKLKRIACIICRRRKLKCDGARPTCSTCARLKHQCGYDETRKKSGPKRGYVRELEKRLKQIETQLETGAQSSNDHDASPAGRPVGQAAFDPTQPGFGANLLPGMSNPRDRQRGVDPESGNSFPWEMMSLGLEEPLPHQDMINDLHQIYFDKLHPSIPMIHRYRYLAAMNLAPSMRPPVALRYAVWSYACSAVDKYQSFTEMFYQRARKYAELDEMRGFGEHLFTVGHVQAWVVIANYEFKMMYFPRAWMSVGRAVRLAQMLGLNRVDGGGLEVKECLPKPKDWVDAEERRRTFWAAYCFDRWASIGTGWPMNIDERDIHTELPTTEDNFDKGREQKSYTLTQMLTGGDPSKLSSYASVVLMASIIGKTLTHLHRTEARDDASDTENGEFWRRHKYLDHVLTNTTVCLPSHLHLSANLKDPNVIFLHMNIHSVTICLHQAAILKAEQNNLGAEMIKVSTDRCYLAATEVANIWRMIPHVEMMTYLSPYVAFCLFVAARVFVHAYKRDPTDTDTRQSLHFLLNAMESHRKRNDITESFLMQLLVDLDELGFDSAVLRRHNALMSHRDRFDVYRESRTCPPVLPRHSDTQPAFKELQAQKEAERLAKDANWRAGMYPDSNIPISMLDSNDFDMTIPMRPATSRDVTDGEGGNLLNSSYDINAAYSGVSPNVGTTVFSHTGPQGQAGFPMPSSSRIRNQQGRGHSPGQKPAEFNFNSPPEFDANLMNAQFELNTEDANMMQDLQGWDTLHGQYYGTDGQMLTGEHSTPGAAWATFIGS